MLDVAVDLRRSSATFGQWYAWELSAENHRQFFIPQGFAHGFSVLSESAICQYKCDNFYAPQADGGISILDDSLGIDWKIPTEKAFTKSFHSPMIISPGIKISRINSSDGKSKK